MDRDIALVVLAVALSMLVSGVMVSLIVGLAAGLSSAARRREVPDARVPGTYHRGLRVSVTMSAPSTRA
jgi:hypothetical protein